MPRRKRLNWPMRSPARGVSRLASSEWTPADLPGLKIWLAEPTTTPPNVFKDTSGAVPCTASLDVVKRWTNAANVAKSATYASSTLIFGAAAPSIPGLIAAVTGVSDYLSLGTGWAGPAFTIYVQFAPGVIIDDSADIYGLFAIASSSTSRISLATGGAVDGGFTVLTSHGSGSITCQSSGNISEDLHCITIVWSSSGLATYLDRTAKQTSTPSSAPSTLPAGDELRICQRYGTSFTANWFGAMTQFLLFHAPHDAATRTKMWDFMGV